MFPPQLYWLPIEKRIDFKLVNFTSPWPLDPQLIRLPYMPCHPIRTLRSSDQLLLLFGIRYLILLGLFYLPLNMLSKLTIFQCLFHPLIY